MEADILRNNLIELKQPKSFVPFVFVLKDGRRFEVKDSDHFGMGLTTVVVLDAEELSVRFKADQVVAIELQKTAA